MEAMGILLIGALTVIFMLIAWCIIRDVRIDRIQITAARNLREAVALREGAEQSPTLAISEQALSAAHVWYTHAPLTEIIEFARSEGLIEDNKLLMIETRYRKAIKLQLDIDAANQNA